MNTMLGRIVVVAFIEDMPFLLEDALPVIAIGPRTFADGLADMTPIAAPMTLAMIS